MTHMLVNGIPAELCPPKQCPTCKTDLEQDGAWPLCPNFSCPLRIYGRLQKYVDVHDIKGAGTETLKELAARGWVKTPAQLFHVDETQFCQLERKGHKHFAKFRTGLFAKQEMTTAYFFASLDIEGRGTWEAITAVPGMQTVPEILKQVDADNDVAFSRAVRVSPERAWAIIREISARREEIDALFNLVIIKTAGSKLVGKTFCITGSLSEPRRQIEARIKDAGGQVSSSVTGRTTHLICNAPSGSSKYKKAQGLHIPIIKESDLGKML